MATAGHALETVRYVVDERASQFVVQAFAGGLISVVAHSPKIAIRDWKCHASFSLGNLAAAVLRAEVQLNSLEVTDELRESEKRELHRVMHQEVLESAKFPELTFISRKVNPTLLKDNLYHVDITGRLNLHGVTNEVDLSTQVAFGDNTLRATGHFTLLQSDYGIKIASIAGGTLKLQDELKFSFYVVARKEK